MRITERRSAVTTPQSVLGGRRIIWEIITRIGFEACGWEQLCKMVLCHNSSRQLSKPVDLFPSLTFIKMHQPCLCQQKEFLFREKIGHYSCAHGSLVFHVVFVAMTSQFTACNDVRCRFVKFLNEDCP